MRFFAILALTGRRYLSRLWLGSLDVLDRFSVLRATLLIELHRDSEAYAHGEAYGSLEPSTMQRIRSAIKMHM
eukprot:6480536-Amphidinium_carterae.1